MAEGAACAIGGLDEDGELCPRVRHAPTEPEAIAAWRAVRRAGVWRRAGMAGALVGLDLNEALKTARLHGARDDRVVVELLAEIEAAAIAASNRQAQASADHRNHATEGDRD